jgi:DNA-binding transcriptional LysR family regulator
MVRSMARANKWPITGQIVRYSRTMFEARHLSLLAAFAAVARRGSFTAAARELGLAKSILSDRVRLLEEVCGARLLERSTRSLRITQVGEQILAVAAAVADATRDVNAILEEHRDAPVGMLRVATTHDLGTRLVAPLVARLAARHPQLRVDMVSDDAPHNLIADGFDVAVRLGAPRDSEHVMRKLWTFPDAILAAPALAARFAHAKRPRDLAAAPWVRHSFVHAFEDVWRFRGPRGEQDEIAVTLRAQANTGDGVRVLLLEGVGLGVLPGYQVTDQIGRGTLVRLCPAWSMREIALYAIVPSARRPPRRVQLFLGALKEAASSPDLVL